MYKQLRRTFTISAALQLGIMVISFIFYRKITLLIYINISFYFSSVLLLGSLFLYTVKTGFFDVIAKSIRMAFTRGHDKPRFEEIPSLSELLSVNQKPLFVYGLITFLFMMSALLVYYI